MADPKSNDAPANAAKPAGASGAVKPPVLEGKARPVGDPAASETSKPADSASKPTGKPAEKPAKAERPTEGAVPPKAAATQAPPATNGLSPWLAGLVGGALGLGAAYGLASAGYWPAPSLPAPVADSRIDALAATVPEVRTIADTTQSELARLTARVATLEAAEPPAPAADLSEALAELGARVDALAEAQPADAADSSANASAIVALQADTTALQDRFGSLTTAVDALSARVDGLAQSVAEAGSDETAILRLPLVLGALESAFASGQPFAAELASLSRIRPEADVPTALSGAAEMGLAAPDAVGQRLQVALPDMLAARPAGADAGWQGATADWFRSILALRPSGPVEGESPDAILARLEDAVSRRDFAAAQAAFAALPEPMQAAAGSLGDDIAALAQARQFLGDLRQAALADEVNP